MKKKSTLLSRMVSTFRGWCFALLLIPVSNLSHAQVQLVKDVNRWADPYSNEFNVMNAFGENLFFHAKNALYYTDGTTAGTQLIMETPAVYGGTTYNGMFYFSPLEGGLWKSDGTVAGTTLVKNINPNYDYIYWTSDFKILNGLMYFTADDGASGMELWRTDGTTAGTVLVKDIKPGSTSSSPKGLTLVGNKLFFAAPSGNNKGIELWASDGTTTGTTMVYDINPGSNSSDPANFIDVNGVCFFTAKNPTYGKELWRSDGTAAGTSMVKDIRPGSAGTISKLATVNGWAFFEAHDGVHGKELWKSDGTEAGTVLVKDIAPGANGSAGIYVHEEVFSYNGIYYFIALNNGHRMWRSDGTEAGTYAITPNIQPEFNFLEFNFTVFNNQVYFFAQHDWTFTELWKTNGTISGTTVVDTKLAYFNYGTYAELEACPSTLFMISQETDPVTGAFSATKLRKSDGTLAGTSDVFEFPGATLGSNPSSFVAINDAVLFSGIEGDSHFTNLYRTDGTEVGTVEVKKFDYIGPLASFNGDKVVFSAYIDYTQGPKLWVSDGTPAGTQNITPSGAHISIRGTVKFGSELLIAATGDYSNTERALYKTNGTLTATVVKSFPADFYIGPSELAAYGNKVLFAASPGPGVQEAELWISDGTSSGTMFLADLRAGGSSHPHEFRPVGDKMAFIAYDGAGYEMFVTDGTSAGSVLVKDFSPGSNDLGQLTPLNDKIIFTVAPNQSERALWITDGTTSGTQILKDFYAGNETIDIVDQLGNNLILLVTNGVTEVWKTDGTIAGTVMVKDLGVSIGFATDASVLNGVLYFGRPNAGGLWRTDGTDCGTYPIEYPGVLSVDEMSVVGSKIIFNGNVNETPYASFYGTELYGYTPEAPVPCMTLATRASQETSDEQGWTLEGLTINSYPNPFQGEIAVAIKGKENRQYGIEIISLNGRAIQSIDNLSFNTTYRMGSHWTQGVYVLKANVGGKIITRKIVKMY